MLSQYNRHFLVALLEIVTGIGRSKTVLNQVNMEQRAREYVKTIMTVWSQSHFKTVVYSKGSSRRGARGPCDPRFLVN